MSILCENVGVAFSGKEYLNVDHFKVDENEVVLLYGPSGSGKTSFYQILCGLSKSNETQSTVKWYDYTVEDLGKANRERYKYISLVYSHFYFLESLTVSQNIALPAILAKVNAAEIQKRLDMLFDIFSSSDNLDLRSLSETPIGELSNGEKELVGIARGLILDTPFIFADEMLRSYNAEDEAVVWEKFFSRELGVGKSRGFFLITHKAHLKEDNRIDKVYTIDNKRLKRVK